MTTIIESFLGNIEVRGTCWIWKRGLNSAGYGCLKINRKSFRSHRISYELFKGEIPKGLTIDHLCRNRACCNPEHLEAVTLKENILRGESIQAKNAKKTHCIKGHAFTSENTYINNNKRSCKICNYNRSINYQIKNPEKCRNAVRKSRNKH